MSVVKVIVGIAHVTEIIVNVHGPCHEVQLEIYSIAGLV